MLWDDNNCIELGEMVVLAGCECDGWLVALCALLLGSSLANKKASRPSLMESWLRMEDQW